MSQDACAERTQQPAPVRDASQPHLHLQLQDGPRLETSWGVDGMFENVKLTRDGKEQTFAAYTFLKGDRLHAGR